MFCLLLLISLLIVSVMSRTLYISPEDDQSTNNSSIVTTLSQCLSNNKTCFTSNTQLLLLPGIHKLQENFILQNLMNISVFGNHSSIKCTKPSVGIAITNITNMGIHDLEITNCSTNYSVVMHRTKEIVHRHTAVHMTKCVSVLVTNVSVVVDTDTDRFSVFNVMMESTWKNVQVTVATISPQNHKAISANGLAIYFYFLGLSLSKNSIVWIENFTYKQVTCLTTEIHDQSVLYISTEEIFYTRYAHVTIRILNTTFENLCNIHVLFHKSAAVSLLSNKVELINCRIRNMKGTTDLFMIRHRNGFLHINNCTFYNNVNITSIITFIKIHTLVMVHALTLIISKCTITHNNLASVINDKYELTMQWKQPSNIGITDTIIASNTHNHGNSLISLNNGILKCDNITVVNNSYYENIVQLNLCYMRLEDNIHILSNRARNIFNTKEFSYFTSKCKSKTLISKNIVYSVLAKEIPKMYGAKQNRRLCCFQLLAIDNIETCRNRIEAINNTYTAPSHLIDHKAYFINCNWIDEKLELTPANFFSKFVTITMTSIAKGNIGIIPSSICKCASSSKYECTSHKLSKIFPGQTLLVNLLVPRLISSNMVTIVVETAHLPPNGCTITKAAEMTQTHTNIGCNQYKYTVWSDKTECELYLSAEGIPETFYVSLLPCPVGFSLQNDLQKCHCDTLLNCDVISVTTCNLTDSTILRPANSWISADTANGSHGYHVSSRCPFDYCLPYSSYLNLSTPDMQCQFNRSGVLCGHCQQGLSAVFGSSRCKKCSNIYLFITIPIAIAGIVLVMMLFVLKLTVTNGTINTFIFYVNIVNTNYSSLLSNCHSLICVLLYIFNLDLGIETCFYNNMSNFSKICLQLSLPFYLILIALSLIIGSRRSRKVQRLTARRGLHVLATLFLLNYGKILSMVCHVLFFYSKITHLPSTDTQIFWSVDTSVKLFGIKFSIIFAVCLLILSALMLFNVLLLFTRILLRFRFVNTFKPLLDPYLGPYKDAYYNWTGLQLLLRSIFFSLSAFHNDISLIGGVIVLGILLCVQGVVHPFKSRFNNIQESLFLLNLLVVFIFASYNGANSTVVEYLILTALVYFVLFIIFTFVSTMMRNTVNHLTSLIKENVKVLKIWSKNRTIKEFSMSNITNEIPNVTFNYKEFREPLVALTD